MVWNKNLVFVLKKNIVLGENMIFGENMYFVKTLLLVKTLSLEIVTKTLRMLFSLGLKNAKKD